MKLQRYAHSSSGFTLMELLVVIAIMMILMGIAVPSFLSWLPTLRLSDAARKVATDLQLARMRAITTNTPQTVTFDTANENYTFGGNTYEVDQLFPGIVISTATDPTFTPRGTANAVTITLSNGSATKQIQVTAVGRVKVL
ncbi:MAG: GspH/FimT family pseudopilin [Candidatus Binatia bacterium]